MAEIFPETAVCHAKGSTYIDTIIHSLAFRMAQNGAIFAVFSRACLLFLAKRGRNPGKRAFDLCSHGRGDHAIPTSQAKGPSFRPTSICSAVIK